MNHVVAVLQLAVICTIATSTLQASLSKSNDAAEDRIINGYVAQQGQFPYIVLILLHGRQYCGGSILSSHWVVSAGHCFRDNQNQPIAPPEYFTVVAGLVDYNYISHPKTQKIPVASIVVHPGFDKGRLIKDIAMVRLQFDLVFTDTVKPIGLPRTYYEIPHEMATTSGWGWTVPATNIPSRILRYFMAPVYRANECQVHFEGQIWDPENKICTMAQQLQQSACHGDSGGPLVQNDVLIGIVSFGQGKCYTTPTFYTRVASYMDFINSYYLS